MSRRWDGYADAATSRRGLMECCACRRPIVAGEYRYREKPETYVTQHRACCPDDPEWAKRDAQAAAHRTRCAELLTAAKAFRDRWEVADLDNLIAELEAE